MGIITVHVLEGRDLVSTITYCKVIAGLAKKPFKTKTVKKTNSPKWSEAFVFEVSNFNTAIVTVECFGTDKGLCAKTSIIGYLNLSLFELTDHDTIDRWFTCTKKKPDDYVGGEIRLAITKGDTKNVPYTAAAPATVTPVSSTAPTPAPAVLSGTMPTSSVTPRTPVKSYGLSPAQQSLSSDEQIRILESELASCSNELKLKQKQGRGVEQLAGFYANQPDLQATTQKQVDELRSDVRHLKSEKTKLESQIQSLKGGQASSAGYSGGVGYTGASSGYAASTGYQGGYDNSYQDSSYSEAYDEGYDEGYYEEAYAPPQVGSTATALYDYVAGSEGELSFHAGDLVTIVEDASEEWFYGSCNGREGHFPKTYVG